MNAHDRNFDPVAELKANVAVPFNRAKAMPKIGLHLGSVCSAARWPTFLHGSGFALGRASHWPSPATM